MRYVPRLTVGAGRGDWQSRRGGDAAATLRTRAAVNLLWLIELRCLQRSAHACSAACVFAAGGSFRCFGSLRSLQKSSKWFLWWKPSTCGAGDG